MLSDSRAPSVARVAAALGPVSSEQERKKNRADEETVTVSWTVGLPPPPGAYRPGLIYLFSQKGGGGIISLRKKAITREKPETPLGRRGGSLTTSRIFSSISKTLQSCGKDKSAVTADQHREERMSFEQLEKNDIYGLGDCVQTTLCRGGGGALRLRFDWARNNGA